MEDLDNFGNYYDFDCTPDIPDQECLNMTSLLTDEEINNIFSKPETEQQCLYSSWFDLAMDPTTSIDSVSSDFCHPRYEYKSRICWPALRIGEASSAPCPNFSDFFIPENNVTNYCSNSTGMPVSKESYHICISDAFYKYMNESSINKTVTVTDYPHFPETSPYYDDWLLGTNLAFILKDIYFFGSIISMILLLAALIIFFMFKSLQCARVHIHKNLLISLLLQCIVVIVMFEPYITVNQGSASKIAYPDIPWLCKTITVLQTFFAFTNITWAFVEGLFLYSRISIAVFSIETPYWLLHLIGWVFPGIMVCIYSTVMHFQASDLDCWRGHTGRNYYWILMAPMILTVAMNLIFLILIIRILVTKLYAMHSAEQVQIREREQATNDINKIQKARRTIGEIGKAMKATVVLLPLLSLTTVFFIGAPSESDDLVAHYAYRITNACLQVLQGILVSVLFCFFNGEVRAALVKSWKNFGKNSLRPGFRSSRASSVCHTQSEHLTVLGGNRRLSHSTSCTTYGGDSSPTPV